MNTKEIRRELREHGFVETNASKHWRYFKNGVEVTLPHGTGSAPWGLSALKSILRRAERANPTPLVERLRHRDISIGRRVRSRIDFVDVPKGTLGKITEDYGSGFLVEWDLPRADKLFDGFDKTRELIFLEPA